MATHIERFKALVEALTGKKPDNAQMNRIADDFISYRRDQIEAAGFDPEKMTNAQKATVVLDAYVHHGNSVMEAMFIRRGNEKLSEGAQNRSKDL